LIQAELKNVSKSFQGRPVLRGLSLEIREHELLSLIGLSGCGKSTTLRLLAGLESVDTGTIHFQGQDVTQVPPYKRDVAIVFQSGGFYDDMTVQANLRSAVERSKLDRKQIDARLNRVTAMLALDMQLDCKPNQLSGGQLQRLALGRGLMRQAGLMLLDEPLNHLDANLRIRLRKQLLDIQRETGQTMVYVTHDPHEAMMMGHRIAVMVDGQIQQVDTPHTIYNRPNHRLVASMLDANTRFYPGSLKISTDQIELVFLNQRFTWNRNEAGRRWDFSASSGEVNVEVGIRAEDWTFCHGNNGNELDGKLSNSVQAKVTWLSRRYLGPSWNLTGTTVGGQEVIAVFGNSSPLPDASADSSTIEVSIDKLHIFECSSGKRIGG
jgi:multiple sugar transport system ATP-binding protein